MPAKSKSQQKFFGMVHAIQTGKLSPSKVSKKVKDTAKNIKKKDAKDFASTKHKKLPNKVKVESIREGAVKDLKIKSDEIKKALGSSYKYINPFKYNSKFSKKPTAKIIAPSNSESEYGRLTTTISKILGNKYSLDSISGTNEYELQFESIDAHTNWARPQGTFPKGVTVKIIDGTHKGKFGKILETVKGGGYSIVNINNKKIKVSDGSMLMATNEDKLRQLIKQEIKNIIKEDFKSRSKIIADNLRKVGYTFYGADREGGNMSVVAPTKSPKHYGKISDILDKINIGKYSLNSSRKPGYYILTLENKLKESVEEQEFQLTREDKANFLTKIKSFNSYYSKFGESNLKEIAEDLAKIAIAAEQITLNETDDWFDKITVNKNMKELKKISENFNKVAGDAHALKERMISLFEDMGHILNRYFEIN